MHGQPRHLHRLYHPNTSSIETESPGDVKRNATIDYLFIYFAAFCLETRLGGSRCRVGRAPPRGFFVVLQGVTCNTDNRGFVFDDDLENEAKNRLRILSIQELAVVLVYKT